ncbi:MAG: VIT1/CCC1 transporter family protein [Thermoplasmata archaeon]
MSLSRLRQRIREATELTDLASTSRRYFVLGAFDGTLIVLGVVLGAYATGAGAEQMRMALFAGLSAAVALSISSAVGAYEAERVDKLLTRAGIERALLADVSEEHAEAFKLATQISALVHAAAPLIAAVVPLLPFVIIPDMGVAVLASVMLTLSVLFILGAYLGNLVREKRFLTGMRFVVAGLATFVILFALGATH